MGATRKQIVQPEAYWVEFQAAARKQKLSLSAWLGYAGMAMLTKTQQAKLPERQQRGRPKAEKNAAK